MAFGTGCRPAPAGRSSGRVVKRAGVGCRPSSNRRDDVVRRVSDRATFVALRTASRRARRGPVTVAYTTIGQGPQPRVAYAIPKSVGSATLRNRIRRRLRAALSGIADDLPAGAYLLSGRRDVAEISFPELQDAVGGAISAASGAGS